MPQITGNAPQILISNTCCITTSTSNFQTSPLIHMAAGKMAKLIHRDKHYSKLHDAACDFGTVGPFLDTTEQLLYFSAPNESWEETAQQHLISDLGQKDLGSECFCYLACISFQLSQQRRNRRTVFPARGLKRSSNKGPDKMKAKQSTFLTPFPKELKCSAKILHVSAGSSHSLYSVGKFQPKRLFRLNCKCWKSTFIMASAGTSYQELTLKHHSSKLFFWDV